MRFYLKKPNQRRISFAIYQQIERPDGTTKNKTLVLPELNAINMNLHNKVIDSEMAYKNCQAVIKDLYKRHVLRQTGEKPSLFIRELP